MPAGDAQQAWFPEVPAESKSFWHEPRSWSEVTLFCTRMTALRKEIRETRDIKFPMMTCPDCGSRGRVKLPDISPRSLLFAFRKIGVVTDEQRKDLDRSWKKYRKSHGLDAYGKPPAVDGTNGCG